MYFNELVICSMWATSQVQWATYIYVHFGRHFFKISSNFSLWLDKDTNGQCFTSQNVRLTALHCPFPHVQHCSPHHGRVNLRNLPDDVGLQLVEGSMTRAGKWETLEKHVKLMAERAFHIHGRSFQSHRTIWNTQKSRQQSVRTHYQDCFLHLDSLQCNALPHKDLSKIRNWWNFYFL